MPLALLALCAMLRLAGQGIPAQYLHDWSKAGLQHEPIHGSEQIALDPILIDNTGSLPINAVLDTAFQKLNGGPGTISIPPGRYLLSKNISLASGQHLQGSGAGKTTLVFDLQGKGDAIVVSGNVLADSSRVTGAAVRGNNILEVFDANKFSVGDFIVLKQNDASLVYSGWAAGSVSQQFRIENITGNFLILDEKLNRDFLNAWVQKFLPVQDVEISCMKIYRRDASSGQTSNIVFNYVRNSRIYGIESDTTNFAHVVIRNSSHNEIRQSWFHHAHAYGGGGQGYGVSMEFGASGNLVENNVFNHLRHSILVQSGANGNVFGYNYSTDPYWKEGFFPADAAGDIVLHGNYPFANLFEGNIARNIVIDNSHGRNGMHNAFYRNRAEGYGLFMSAANTDSMIIAGNEIVGVEGLLGQYNVLGTGHFQADNRVKGEWKFVTGNALPNSLYLNTRPKFWELRTDWPGIGTQNSSGNSPIPAMARWKDSSFKAFCYTPKAFDPAATTANKPVSIEFKLLPNPASDLVKLINPAASGIAVLFDYNAKVLRSYKIQIGENQLDISGLPNGLYLLQFGTHTEKLVIQQ